MAIQNLRGRAVVVSGTSSTDCTWFPTTDWIPGVEADTVRASLSVDCVIASDKLEVEVAYQLANDVDDPSTPVTFTTISVSDDGLGGPSGWTTLHDYTKTRQYVRFGVLVYGADSEPRQCAQVTATFEVAATDPNRTSFSEVVPCASTEVVGDGYDVSMTPWMETDGIKVVRVMRRLDCATPYARVHLYYARTNDPTETPAPVDTIGDHGGSVSVADPLGFPNTFVNFITKLSGYRYWRLVARGFSTEDTEPDQCCRYSIVLDTRGR